MASHGELALRLVVAAALAGVLGAERELTEQPAGMRTHMLVGVGAALFTIVSAYGFEPIVHAGGRNVNVDVSRVTAGIVSGIGFLGAGAILKYGASIRGLTTAASLWVTAAIGTAVGTGQLLLSVVGVAIVLLALAGLRPLRQRLRRHAIVRQEMVIEIDPDADVTAVMHEVQELGVPVSRVRLTDDGPTPSLHIIAQLPRKARPADLAARLAAQPGVGNVDWS